MEYSIGSSNKIGILILAAGSSSRLGKSKQLVKIDGKTLIRRVCETALAVAGAPVLVITGAQAEEVSGEIGGLPVKVIFNEDWEEGMASSIRKGIDVFSLAGMDAVLILLCDQVNLSGHLLREIRDAYLDNNSELVCCSYGGTLGVPALFDKSLFPELLELRGDTGAKPVIKRHLSKAIAVSFTGGETDIDRPSDVEGLG